MASEFHVYSRLIEFLNSHNWFVVCASPPAGTDGRYRKCILPRRNLLGSERGPRDEVDLIAKKVNMILLVECKPKLSDSLERLNNQYESDYDKLKRILNSLGAENLSVLLSRAYGIEVIKKPIVAIALAVGRINCRKPADISVFEFSGSKCNITALGHLAHQFKNP